MKKICLTLTLFHSFSASAFAVQGLYLDAATLPKNVCKLIAYGFAITDTPIDGGGHPTNEPPIVSREEEYFFCSATIVDPTHILTASHCYEGAVEQNIVRFKEPIRRLVRTIVNGEEKWVPPLQCRTESWYQDPSCIAGFKRFQRRVTIDRMDVICPGDAAEERFTVAWEEGWPNPQYSANRPQYDVSVLKIKNGKFKTKPMPIVTDASELTQMMRSNADSCRSYGYGLDNDQTYGNYHGVKTPVSLLTWNSIAHYGEYGRTNYGDSGGALICADSNGQDRLVGVVSYGLEWEGDPFQSPPPGAMKFVYASVAYNSSWIKRILNEGIHAHGSSLEGLEYYHKVALGYEFEELRLLVDIAESTIARKKNYIDPIDRRNAENKIDETLKWLKKWEKEARKGETPSGLIRIDVKAGLATIRQIIDYFEEY